MRARWNGPNDQSGREREIEREENKRQSTYMGTSCPQAKFGTINKIEQDRIPPL